MLEFGDGCQCSGFVYSRAGGGKKIPFPLYLFIGANDLEATTVCVGQNLNYTE
jgi:hypothetical protein